jgi:hypothetical protein
LLLCYAWQHTKSKKDGHRKNHITSHVCAAKGLGRREIADDQRLQNTAKESMDVFGLRIVRLAEWIYIGILASVCDSENIKILM